MNRTEAISYLTRCADANGQHWYQGRVWSDVDTCPTCHGTNDAGWLACPGSRYGRTSAHCAPVAYRFAQLVLCDTDEPQLDYAMGLVVNDSDSVAEHFTEHAVALAGADIDAIVDGYLDCQLWAGLDMDRDDDGTNPPLDENYGRDDIDPEYVDKVRAELTEVVTEHPLAVRMYLAAIQCGEYASGGTRSEHFGHDFYLTREGHGAGFWDRGLGELGDYLTGIAKAYGSAEQLFDNGEGVLS